MNKKNMKRCHEDDGISDNKRHHVVPMTFGTNDWVEMVLVNRACRILGNNLYVHEWGVRNLLKWPVCIDHYVGIDTYPHGSQRKYDMLNLPFSAEFHDFPFVQNEASGGTDLILSILTEPHTIHEANRILRPGGLFVGTVDWHWKELFVNVVQTLPFLTKEYLSNVQFYSKYINHYQDWYKRWVRNSQTKRQMVFILVKK